MEENRFIALQDDLLDFSSALLLPTPISICMFCTSSDETLQTPT